MTGYLDRFKITDKICIITGGAGLLGLKHAEAVLEGGGIPVLLDISDEALTRAKAYLLAQYPSGHVETIKSDITSKEQLTNVKNQLLALYGHIDALINNAANNPKMEGNSTNMAAIRFDNFPIDMWNMDLAVGLTGALLCSQVFGSVMEEQKSGVIINISSDYGLISPDQRIYQKDDVAEEQQLVKPISYSVVKHGIIGMTKYLATYWAQKGIRVNTLCPASLYNGQDPEFVNKLSNLIPMGRMSRPDEYVCTVLYMLSDASTYMTGATIVLDGGRTCW